MRKNRRIAVAFGAAAAVAASVWLTAGSEGSPGTFAEPREIPPWPATPARAKALRNDALSGARVWRPSDVGAFDFGANPADPSGWLSQPQVDCRFIPVPISGTTPKFNCVLPDGEVVKVKYGRNPEIQAEAAATRLLTGLGFRADRIYIVPLIRCYGCPPLPFHTGRVLDLVRAGGLPGRLTPDNRAADYEWVAVERRFEGRPIEVDGEAGWAWNELKAGEGSGGATAAEIDAFRLIAAFLVHWDNKAPNQRLVCLSADEGDGDEACPEPFAIIQDLGASFGPHKVDVRGWQGTPVWADRAACTVSMRHLPFLGATFPDTRISEAGRQLLARQLRAMSERQISALFTGARFVEYERGRWFGPAADHESWVSAFRDKVRQVVEGNPCP